MPGHRIITLTIGSYCEAECCVGIRFRRAVAVKPGLVDRLASLLSARTHGRAVAVVPGLVDRLASSLNARTHGRAVGVVPGLVDRLAALLSALTRGCSKVHLSHFDLCHMVFAWYRKGWMRIWKKKLTIHHSVNTNIERKMKALE